MSRCFEVKWTRGQVPSFALPLPIIEADPAITHDGKRLYFISSRHAPEKEDFDIWYVDRAEEGWGQPVRLPAPVNTTNSEIDRKSVRVGKECVSTFRSRWSPYH